MRRPLLLALLAGLAGPALAQSQSQGQHVVVTGTRVQDFRDRLAACLARQCPPDEDIDATLALAEALFVEGEYGDARRAIRSSMSRNREEARNYPEPVSDLYRAGTRVAEHLGRDREAEIYVYQILGSLRAGLPIEDHRHFTARLEIARSLAALGRPEIARRELRRLTEVARAGGREDVANLAELRSLWLDYLETPYGPARRRLLELSRYTDPQRALLAYGAKALLIRIYSREGNDERADALIATMGGGDSNRQLLYAPAYQLVQQTNVDGNAHRESAVYDRGLLTDNLAERMTDTFDDKWIDVGFWVQPDGQVDDLQLLRRGPGGGGWEAPLLESIRGRRYSPADRPTYRLERYTYTATWHTTSTGSHIPDRSPRARIEYLDLTAGAQSPGQGGN
jgi:tetratricopeptide (TPR) repeat protein